MWKITPSQLKGEITIPSSKSQSMRALLFGLLAQGKSAITHLLPSSDMIQVCRQLGAEIEEKNECVVIQGIGGKLNGAEDVIQARNSGLILRLVGAVAALSPKSIVITGDHSIRHNRPIRPLLEGLTQLGATAFSLNENDRAPILVKGPLFSGRAKIDGADSQPISGLLIAGSFAPGPVELFVENPGELPWVNLTLDWLSRFHIPYQATEGNYYRLEGGAAIEGFSYAVPGDFSSLAFPLVAALLTDSEVRFNNLDFSDSQGDKKIIEILKKMGAKIEREERSVVVKKGSQLQGTQIDVNACIDALPILAVVGCFAEGETELIGGGVARNKECDRIHSIATQLRKMGAAIEERVDGLLIKRSDLKGAIVESYEDHRMALALAVAGLAAKGGSEVHHVACVSKTFPNFQIEMQHLGACIQ